jgi:cyclophilin family peptidyl-prolyl cis-trans isomerase
LCAARDGNPQKASSASQFYIVQGKVQTDAEIQMLDQRKKLSDAQKAAYKTVGGTPFLDGEYTVFGQVIEGLEIVDKIADVKTGQADRPMVDVRILKVTEVKKRKKFLGIF